MSEPDRPPRALARWATTALLLGLAGLAGIGLTRLTAPDAGPTPDGAAPPAPSPGIPVTPWAINRPPVTGAADAVLTGTARVVGVSMGGRFRAYLVRALSHDPRMHVVNDRLGGQPVSVVHCDETGCTRVFTGPAGGGRLPLAFGGRRSGQMLIQTGGAIYSQSTLKPLKADQAPFPFEQASFTMTTWQVWRAAHPDTDVYMGTDPPQAADLISTTP
jgi:hypothetical protein